MKVEVWSDVVCPWCYVGKRRLEAALAHFAHANEVQVTWRSFELDPRAPAVHGGDYAGRLAGKYRVTPTEARSMIERMTGVAATVGLAFAFDRARPGNTFDAHRLLHLAADEGLQDRVKERLLAATFVEGAPIGDRATLLRLGVDAGLGAGRVAAVLGSDEYASGVRADEERARVLGITSVPFFVVDGAVGVAGAQPPEVLLDLLERGWDAGQPPVSTTSAALDGDPGCEGDRCAV